MRDALGRGDMDGVAALLGRPYSISGHVVHGRKLGAPSSGFKTAEPALLPLEAGRQRHLRGAGAWPGRHAGDRPLPGVANLGIRPSLDPNDVNGGRVLLETHCLEWPAELGAEGAYGKIIRVELLHKLHDELQVRQSRCPDGGHRARTATTRVRSLLSTRRQTTRDRI